MLICSFAPALHLRYNVPAAGTAAIHAIKVGWSDAKHVYGRLLREQKALEKKIRTVTVIDGHMR